MDNKVQLVTYVDRFGRGNLKDFKDFLEKEMPDLFAGLHLLPFFYPYDGADAGYDPNDNRILDPRIGKWENVKSLSSDYPIILDLIINHISEKSTEFRDVLSHGSKSKYFDLFLTKEKVFGGMPKESEIDKIYRPRPNRPFSLRKIENGENIEFWTTFSHKQIDIDVNSILGKQYIDSILKIFSDNEIKIIRLDAVGYAIKKPGTSCFMIPETYAFIDKVVSHAHSYGIEVLVEIHSHYQTQIEIAKHSDYVYDFALPPLVLHSLFSKNFERLKYWYTISPKNCITVLDTHDGIGVMDVASTENSEGLITDKELDKLVNTIHSNSNGESQKATGSAASNLDLYQVNCTFYSALSCSDAEYIIARAIQFFSPGIPQVYYAGFLAEANDMELLKSTSVGRDINRPYLDWSEIKDKLEKPVVKVLIDLIKFRNTNASFKGEFNLIESNKEVLHIVWTNDKVKSELIIDLLKTSCQIKLTEDNKSQWIDLMYLLNDYNNVQKTKA